METLNGTWVRFGVFPALTPKIEFKLFKLFHQTTMALKFHAGLAENPQLFSQNELLESLEVCHIPL